MELGPEDFTVRFAQPGVMLDLGAIGKGYAVERAAELLRESGVTSALLHGGTSTTYALGHPPGADSWQVAIVKPPGSRGACCVLREETHHAPRTTHHAFTLPSQGEPGPLALVPLRDEALSVSAVWGRCFEAEGRTFGHVIDPRTGQPAANALLAAVVLPAATETDALSTALLTLGPEGHAQIAGLRPAMRTLVVADAGGRVRIEARGIVVRGA